MDTLFLGIVIFLIVLAVFDLVVGVKMIRRLRMSEAFTSLTFSTAFARSPKRIVPSPGSATE